MSTDEWMRPEDWRALAGRDLEMARETLDEASLMAEHEHWRGYVNRLYYACFYAVSALLASEAHSAKTHSGVRALFAKHFVQTEHVSKKQADFFGTLFDHRHRGDYEVSFEIDPAVVRPWQQRAVDFVATITALIEAEA